MLRITNGRAVLALDKATEAAADFARASKAASTLRAYRTDAADFTVWCDRHDLSPLPASVDTLASYLCGASLHASSGWL
jgi:site-specific recombinase XerD